MERIMTLQQTGQHPNLGSATWYLREGDLPSMSYSFSVYKVGAIKTRYGL